MNVPAAQYRALLSTYLRPQGKRVVVLAVFLCGSIGLQLVNPQILRTFIDTAGGQARGINLTAMAAVFLVVALGQQVLAVLATYVGERVGWTATNALRGDLTLHLLELDLSFHKARTPGELIERIDGDVTAMANFFSQFVVQVLGSLLLLAGVLVVLWTVDWRVGLVLSVFAILVLGGMARLRTLATPYWAADRQASAELFGFVEERLAATVDVRSSGAQRYVMGRLYAYMRRRYEAGNRAIITDSVVWTVPILGFALGNGVAFALAALLYKTAALTLGTAFLIYSYTQVLFQPINLLSNQIDDFQKASAGITRVQELLAVKSALPDGPEDSWPSGALGVAFEDVSFAYEGDEMILRDLSFTLPPGHVLGLLGRTGSGKTTIARLLLRLYDPSAGRILLGGIDLRAARRDGVRRAIGMVTQDVQLFRATVRDNLTFFDASIGDDRIMAALATLGLEGWCRGLPRGLDTMLAAGGGGLSAGEAQLLAFTRVFLKDPGLIILDEASSRLDPATERLIERAVERLLEGRTGIIIAHRLATVERTDTILILDDGQIAEYGSRAALVRDPDSRFARLLHTGVAEVLV